MELFCTQFLSLRGKVYKNKETCSKDTKAEIVYDNLYTFCHYQPTIPISQEEDLTAPSAPDLPEKWLVMFTMMYLLRQKYMLENILDKSFKD